MLHVYHLPHWKAQMLTSSLLCSSCLPLGMSGALREVLEESLRQEQWGRRLTVEASLSRTMLELDASQRTELSGMESPDCWGSSGVWVKASWLLLLLPHGVSPVFHPPGRRGCRGTETGGMAFKCSSISSQSPTSQCVQRRDLHTHHASFSNFLWQ